MPAQKRTSETTKSCDETEMPTSNKRQMAHDGEECDQKYGQYGHEGQFRVEKIRRDGKAGYPKHGYNGHEGSFRVKQTRHDSTRSMNERDTRDHAVPRRTADTISNSVSSFFSLFKEKSEKLQTGVSNSEDHSEEARPDNLNPWSPILTMNGTREDIRAHLLNRVENP
ncbi:hypothetical protein TGAMA5MH_05948 [Trichoderma gamsii]|uniref:Uncharacterized protein n=1 Tax=Trichoderma gamsii TaxID=398673 RepID=A0A2K0T9R0_9HYPO|nr:hypothetical protein TGAMA5MH_05948 [Trichoderma gamsii]